MHGTASALAATRARFQESAPEPSLDGLYATVDVYEVAVPFGIVDARVTVTGEGDDWYVSSIDVKAGEIGGRTLWAAVAKGDPAGAVGGALERAIFEAVMSDIKADRKFADRAVEALMQQMA